jgi:hypothetical protein
MRRDLRRVGVALAFLVSAGFGGMAPGPAGAMNRPVNLVTMTERAGTIVSGRITALHAGSHPRYRNIGVLYVTVKASEVLKGQPAETVTFMQFTGRLMDDNGGKGLTEAHPLPDMPSYRVGEEVVLFLYPPSSAGFTSPVGGEQGKLRVQRRAGEPVTVIRDGGNRSPGVGGTLPSRLSPAQRDLIRSSDDTLDYQTFHSTVKSLLKGGKSVKAR